jgi:hypothetical protein
VLVSISFHGDFNEFLYNVPTVGTQWRVYIYIYTCTYIHTHIYIHIYIYFMDFDNLAGVEWVVACIWYLGVFLIVNGSQHVSATSTYLCEKIWTQWMQRMWE